MDDLLSRRVRASPDATALVDTGSAESPRAATHSARVDARSGREWTFADLDDAVDATAGRLAELGVTAGDRVGILMETRPAFVRLVFAVARLGGVAVPLNARLAPSELIAQREAADLICLVCEADTEADALAAAEPVPVLSVDKPQNASVGHLAAVDAAEVTPAVRAPTEPVALVFTSGTTGDPKAVRLTPRNFLASATASAFRLGVDPDDRWLCPLSMYHMGGLSVVVRSMLYGTTAVLTRGFDAEVTLDALHEYDCTGVSLVPTMLQRLLDAGELPDSLRFVLVGGAPTPRDLVETCEARGVPIHPSYGMTEATSQIATATPREAFDDPETVGRPLLPTDVTVVDEAGVPVERGEVGELVVAGPTVTPGYDDPEQTEDAFGPHGFHTGDVGYVDDAGRLHVLNRRSDRIITGGENVHPGEVVDVLRGHPDVEEAAVVGVEDPEWGERVAALVVPTGGTVETGLTADDVREYCRERLAGYKIPRTVVFVDSLPLTASGTVDRAAARERVLEESSEGGADGGAADDGATDL